MYLDPHSLAVYRPVAHNAPIVIVYNTCYFSHYEGFLMLDLYNATAKISHFIFMLQMIDEKSYVNGSVCFLLLWI